MKFQRLCFPVVLLATMMAIGGRCAAACTNASFTGVWGFQIGTAVGQLTANGSGSITAGSDTVNQNGTVVNQTFTGTYTVATNCTGKLTLNFVGGGSATASFVLDNGNLGAQIIETIAGASAEGPAAAQGTVTCGLTGTKTTYAALLLGQNTTGLVDDVAQVILDGKGNVTGSGTFDVGGTIHAATITGTYTEGTNCQGTIKMTPRGLSTLNFAFVVVNAGKQLLLIETDSTASVFGNMQR
jgi:hypothetical protein